MDSFERQVIREASASWGWSKINPRSSQFAVSTRLKQQPNPAIFAGLLCPCRHKCLAPANFAGKER